MLEMPDQSFDEEMHNVDRWLAELKSLGVSAKRKNELNDAQELRTLTENIKDTMYRQYKTAYSEAV